MHCHHEKIVIVDGEIAFVGGIDLTSLGGDRFDDARHTVRGGLGWHDVATRLRGPAVADVDEHFRTRWHEVTEERLAPVAPPEPVAGGVPVQVLRTVPEDVYDALPEGDFRILEAYTRALRDARSLIYLENQFLWSPEIVDILEDKLRDPPSPSFRIVVLLPAKPNNGDDDTRGQAGRLVVADDGAGRFLAATVRQRTGAVTGPLYVHAKVGIVDDRWLTIGSANLNEHSLFNDSEMNVLTCDPDLARATRLRLWAEHLEASRRGRRRARPRRRRPAVAPDRPRAAPAARRGAAGDPPPHRAARRLPALRRAARAAAEPRRRRLTTGRRLPSASPARPTRRG